MNVPPSLVLVLLLLASPVADAGKPKVAIRDLAQIGGSAIVSISIPNEGDTPSEILVLKKAAGNILVSIPLSFQIEGNVTKVGFMMPIDDLKELMLEASFIPHAVRREDARLEKLRRIVRIQLRHHIRPKK